MSIKTNSVTAYGITTYFELIWTSTQNVNDNSSLLNLQLITRQDPAGSGYQRTILANGSKVVVNDVAYNISEQKAWDGKAIWNIENISISHNPDGTKSINASVQVNVGGDYVSGSGTIVLPTIQRTTQVSVSPKVLSSGNANISVTKYVDTYTTTIKYKVEGTEYTLATKSAATSFSLSFNDLKALIGSFTSSVVEITAITYNNDFEVGSDRKSIIVQTGKIPLSLYDDRQGNVGATFGEKATGKDVHFKLPVHFYNEVYGLPSTTYKPDDILRLDFYGIYAGVLTSGQKEIGFTLFLDKPIDESVTEVNIGSIKCNISTYGNVYLGRGSSWYNGGYEYVGQSGYTVEVNWKAGLSAITIWIKKSSTYTSTTALNNSAVIIRAQDLIINFS